MNAGQPGPALQVDAVTVAYGGRVACDTVTLVVQPGEVVAVCGGNGAGKSTLLRAACGLVPATGGTVRVCGHDVGDPAGVERARQVSGWCPDRGGLIPAATLREHIGLALAARGKRDLWAHAISLATQLDIEDALDVPTGGYSHGMARRAGILLACLGATGLLLLDEPFDGLDELGVATVTGLIGQAAAHGIGCVVTTHLLDALEPVCDRVVVMRRGRVAWQGLPGALTGVDGVGMYRKLLAGTR